MMHIRTPEFWCYDGSLARLLQPAASIYGWIAHRRWHQATPSKIEVPVVCVGNLTAGGTGKTPTALFLARLLLAEGRKVHFLTRGYGGKSTTAPVQADPLRHTVQDVGDEALLLAACAPCWVTTDRFRGAQMAQAAGAEIIIMDDGFQNPSLHKNFSLIVVDGHYGFGNGRLLPAGPLRETPEHGLKRTNAVLIIGEDRRSIAKEMPENLPVLHARMMPSGYAEWMQGTAVVAFAGIGLPEKFFAMLEAAGCKLVAHLPFPDHYCFQDSDLERITALAEQHDALPVTTEKDMVRLPEKFRQRVRAVPAEIQLQELPLFRQLLSAAGVL